MWEYNHLEHEGQKGQHWGDRRYQYPDGKYTPLGLLRRRAEYRAARREARDAERRTTRVERRVNRMTDQELRDATNRLNLETNYLQAMERRHSGQTYVRDTLRQIGRNAAVTFATKATGIAVDAFVRQLSVATADLSEGSLGNSLHNAAVAAQAGKKDKD